MPKAAPDEDEHGTRIHAGRYSDAYLQRASWQLGYTIVVWRGHHAAESLSRGSRVVVVGRLQQRAWTAEDGSARQVVEVVAEELGPSLRWATATPVRITKSGA